MECATLVEFLALGYKSESREASAQFTQTSLFPRSRPSALFQRYSQWPESGTKLVEKEIFCKQVTVTVTQRPRSDSVACAWFGNCWETTTSIQFCRPAYHLVTSHPVTTFWFGLNFLFWTYKTSSYKVTSQNIFIWFWWCFGDLICFIDCRVSHIILLLNSNW